MLQIATQCAKLELEKYQATEQYFKAHPGAGLTPARKVSVGEGWGSTTPAIPGLQPALSSKAAAQTPATV